MLLEFFTDGKNLKKIKSKVPIETNNWDTKPEGTHFFENSNFQSELSQYRGSPPYADFGT
jgi:hypothetical protein